ncbi:MAG: hypothetical protein E7468_05005 [Ruminococcaceae bacterium]|nr:hypothetical protein [Oscillospiraceae bacterium]
MEENKELEQVSAEEMNAEVLKQDTYVARPKWQIVAAWVGIAVVAVGFILYCWQIANGGL